MTIHFRPLPDDYPEFVYGRCDASGVIIGGKFHPLKAGVVRIVATLFNNLGRYIHARELAKAGGIGSRSVVPYCFEARQFLRSHLGMKILSRIGPEYMIQRRD